MTANLVVLTTRDFIRPAKAANRKSWRSTTDIGYLADAFRDILDLQANLCSFGVSKLLEVTTYLRNRNGRRQGSC